MSTHPRRHRPTHLRGLVAVGTALFGTMTPTVGSGEVRTEVETFLRAHGFADDDVAALDAGEVIVRSQGTKGEGEMAALAAVRIRAPLERVASYYGQMVAYVDGKVTLGFGRFSTPPALPDVAELTFERAEVEAMKSCRPGECGIRLGGAALEGLRSAVDWSAPDHFERANDFAREAAVRYVTAYLERGDEALVTYDDRDRQTSLADEWLGILGNTPYFHDYDPALGDYLRRYPNATLQGARDVLYWIKEDYGFKPVISIVHAVIYQPPQRPDRVFVAQKQIYASHYFDASLALASVVEAEEDGAPVSYLIYGNRSRGNLLQGGFSGLKKRLARDQVAKAARQTLGTIQRVVEAGVGAR